VPAPSPFVLVGNHPATDLCNTTPVLAGRAVDLLADVRDLARWLRAAGIATDVRIERLPADEQRAALVHAKALRDRLRPTLEAAPTPHVLARLNDVLAATGAVLHVAGDPPGVRLVADRPAAQLRVDLTVAVADIFRHDLARIRRCASPECVLLFLDTSKSGRRRWCDMSTCGNRAKAATHYRRHQRQPDRPDLAAGRGGAAR
jgi:predicted RNA-binding Zn ribbon-like protein